MGTVALVVDDFRCVRCTALFRWKRPQHHEWIPAPGPDPVTGKHDPERGFNRGDPPPTCPHCGSKYVRRIIAIPPDVKRRTRLRKHAPGRW